MIKNSILTLAVFGYLFTLSLTAQAQTSASTTTPAAAQPNTGTTSVLDEITYDLAPYGWLTALNGQVGIKGFTTHVNLSINDVLDNLDGAFMTTFNLHYKDWSFNNDLIWAELSGSTSTPLQQLYTGAKLTINQITWTETIGYRVYNDESSTLELNAGFRLNSLSNDLKLSGAQLETKYLDEDEVWIDPIVGFRGGVALPYDFSIRAGGDIGGFDSASELTWQAWTAVGYEVGCGSTIGAGYRALGYDYNRNGFEYNVNSYGPFFGAEFRF